MPGRHVLLLALLLSLGSCNLLKLDQQMQQAHQQLQLVSGQLRASDSGNSAWVALLDEHSQVLEYRISAPREGFYFTVAPGHYQLLAFEDRNANFRLDRDEPRQWLQTAQTTALAVQPNPNQWQQLIQLNPIELHSRSLAAAPKLDLRLQVLYGQQPRLQSNYLQPISLNDVRFDPQSVSLGAWQPLTFIQQFGYGLYLLAPWDKDKEPIFLVHGINSSPRDWQELLAKLDLRHFQPVLFHYPSGLPLNNSAYLLSVAMRDVQLRYGPRRMHIFAHSMGGLLARRAVQQLSPSDDQRLCLFITLSTPWAGHPSAASGVRDVPLDIPLWRDLAPGSAYLQRLFANPLPAHMRQWLLVSYSGNNSLLPTPNDGVVPLASELDNHAQDEAEQLFMLAEDHNSILSSSRSSQLLNRALASLPSKGCRGKN
ncbi:esterase/lipase family protein [Pseudomonas sp. 5P_3.1_Bac2]|uniref:esterase/lipase family protein n=1 Tax=Pseudomonas sp. 5P_3.1_Bac2 TaxID=2971617 RepID=UPI0021C71C8D|nr:alpha/beta fold hydrolase [Pseudomonas sp. 5P_3.1_Bac2]MCU1718506.1 alpha/beta fold hydrolase [Pseudomonas sp. 5P_3.1_Bac2]